MLGYGGLEHSLIHRNRSIRRQLPHPGRCQQRPRRMDSPRGSGSGEVLVPDPVLRLRGPLHQESVLLSLLPDSGQLPPGFIQLGHLRDPYASQDNGNQDRQDGEEAARQARSDDKGVGVALGLVEDGYYEAARAVRVRPQGEPEESTVLCAVRKGGEAVVHAPL